MSRSIHASKLVRRRNWRNTAFEILGTRSLNDIPKGDRSKSLREVLKSKKGDKKKYDRTKF